MNKKNGEGSLVFLVAKTILLCNLIFSHKLLRSFRSKHVGLNKSIFLFLYVINFSGGVVAESFDEASLNDKLVTLELKRTQSPQFVSDSLKDIKKLINKMSLEQRYRYVLLQAHSYGIAGKPNDAFQLLNQQLKNEFPIHLKHYKARTLSLLANSYSHYNYFSDALKTLHQLLPLLSEVNDIESEVIGYRLAIELFGELRMRNEALSYANVLYSKFDEIVSPRHKCFVAFNYAESFLGVYGSSPSLWSKVESLYANAYELCNTANEKMIMAVSALGQSNMLIKRRAFLEARELAKHGLDLSISIPYPHDIAEGYLTLARIDISESLYQAGLVELKKALDISLTLGDSKLLSKVYKPLAKLSEELGESEKALEYLKLYQQHHEKILGEIQSKIIAFETTKLDYLEKERQIRYLNKDRELYTAKAELTESQRNNERMMFLLICGSLVVLTLFAINMTLQKRKYMRLAQFDALTGIFNRGTGQNLAENRYIKDSMSGIDFSVVLFDLDRFKSVNDNYGHAMGDWVLKKVCEVVSKECRSSDIFTRFGGEEFVLFMPNTSESVAREVAVKCKARILAIDTRYSGHEFTISASFGVATSTEKDLSLDPILQRADIAMYQSKEQGRERD
ncbi:GGDEF domain-containing protein [Shewanella woodyi]|uniref:diguanylate cyclase n=1 Tax=Shewanella woodyi (strain ATCC 51908 / MS32) TaxID=392500 RepID=B1KKH4_SHEWM|nr:GGDEF domain-containing protein [Shewanella woodyi]ACA85814.1 diguanylate cyclase [Shewanella woodyi ATCC 51908]